jgi:hypothetical protein
MSAGRWFLAILLAAVLAADVSLAIGLPKANAPNKRAGGRLGRRDVRRQYVCTYGGAGGGGEGGLPCFSLLSRSALEKDSFWGSFLYIKKT